MRMSRGGERLGGHVAFVGCLLSHHIPHIWGASLSVSLVGAKKHIIEVVKAKSLAP